MKYFLLLFLLTLVLRVGAQNAPSYIHPPLDTSIKSLANWDTVNKKWVRKEKKNVSSASFRDTIYPIFSEFALGSNVFSKNANILTAEVTSKDTRLAYNAAAFWKLFKIKGIYNAEIFASGKDNVAKVFSDSKFQGTFGLNVTASYLLNSSMFYLTKDADKLLEKRVSYYYLIKQKADILTDVGIQGSIQNDINSIENQIKSAAPPGTTNAHLYKAELYNKLQKLKDSLANFKNNLPNSFFEDEITAFERKYAKWTGFSLLTMDIKLGISSDGYNYYNQISTPVNYPVISENGKRFVRRNAGVAVNWIVSISALSNKLSGGTSLNRFIGFDGETPKDILQSTRFDSTNVTRSFEKKYSAYALKPNIMDTYTGWGLTFGDQLFLGKQKFIGLGFSTAMNNYINGQYKDKTVWDHSYSLYFALSKKGDPLNKNVIGITLTTPDVNSKLPKSYNSTTGEKLKMKDKLTVGISFGLTLDKLMVK